MPMVRLSVLRRCWPSDWLVAGRGVTVVSRPWHSRHTRHSYDARPIDLPMRVVSCMTECVLSPLLCSAPAPAGRPAASLVNSTRGPSQSPTGKTSHLDQPRQICRSAPFTATDHGKAFTQHRQQADREVKVNLLSARRGSWNCSGCRLMQAAGVADDLSDARRMLCSLSRGVLM